jgi:hypothetical protein
MFERDIVGGLFMEKKMKIIIYVVAVFLLLGTPSLADEIVLKTGEIVSGDVLDLTENTIRIRVDGQEREIDRVRIEAAFLGEQTPFSAKEYISGQSVARKDEHDE